MAEEGPSSPRGAEGDIVRRRLTKLRHKFLSVTGDLGLAAGGESLGDWVRGRRELASARAFRLCLTVVHSTSVPASDECVAGRSVLLWAVTMTSVPEQVPSVGPTGMAAAVESLVVGGPRGRLEVGASVLPSAVSEYPIPFPRPVTDVAV